MTPQGKDEAKELAELFKKQGYFDKLKNDILSKDITQEESKVKFDELVKEEVANAVKEMVNRDENLIFKNRGTTSALIETQFLKDDYNMLNENGKGIDIEEFIKENVSDIEIRQDILKVLQSLQDK